MVNDTDREDTGDYEITGLTFKRIMPGRKVIKGSADQFPYTLEDRVINGEIVKVKVYLPASVIYGTDQVVSSTASVTAGDGEED